MEGRECICGGGGKALQVGGHVGEVGWGRDGWMSRLCSTAQKMPGAAHCRGTHMLLNACSDWGK